MERGGERVIEGERVGRKGRKRRRKAGRSEERTEAGMDGENEWM